MESGRERTENLCRRESITGQNYYLKRYVLRLVLQAGREGLRRTANEREFMICAPEKQSARCHAVLLFFVCLFFEEGHVKGSIIRRRTQRTRRDINLEKVSQVLRGSANDD